MRRNNGAKARMGIMQGRGMEVCSAEDCGEEMGIAPCGSCGEMLCTTCRMDHDCLDAIDQKARQPKPKGCK